MWTDLLYRLRALFRRSAVESDLAEELRDHQERQIEKYIAAGMSRAEAARRTRLEFGGPQQVGEDCRDARGTRWIEDLLKDARYGLRNLRRNPVFAAVAVLSLALGIGANTAIFSVVNAVLLKPLPYRDPAKLVMIWDTHPAHGSLHNVISPADFVEWQRRNTVFEGMAAMNLALSNLSGMENPEEIRGQFVTASFFPLLGVQPAIGRLYTAEEAGAGAKVVVLSHRLWQRRFAGDPAVLGRSLELDRELFTIIGVMPRDFEFFDSDSEFWRPFFLDPGRDYLKEAGRYMYAVARLKPGSSLQQAQAQFDGIAARLAQDYPEFHKGWGVRVVDLREEVSGEYRRPLHILLGAVSLVLLIACVNVANLLLSRAASRRREMAVRSSMGAGPLRLARQLFAESFLLALLGSAGGLLLALWGVHVLKGGAGIEMPRLSTIEIDGRVLAFTTLLSVAAAVLFGVAPALAGARVMPGETLKCAARGGGSTSRRRLPDGLVMIEFALSLILLAGAGLLIRSFTNLLSVETGFRADHLLTARVLLPGSYNKTQAVAFFQEAVRRIEALPAVRSASSVSFKPFGGVRPATGFIIENRPAPGAGEAPVTEVRTILPHYFRTMGIALLRGRDFTGGEADPAHPVFIVNQSLAAKYWPNQDPIGQRITVDMTDKPVPGEIVGIVADVKDTTLDGGSSPCVFYPLTALPSGYMSFVVRTVGDPAALARAVVQVVHSVDRHQPVVDIQTLDQMMRRSVSTRHFQMLLLVFFAGIAMVLAAVGIYGVISYAVAQRTSEIGIRMALGACRLDVLRLVAAQGVAILLGGLLLGLAGAFALTRTISTMLFEVKSTDPLTFAAGALLLVLVAVAAIVGPARRASKVDPLIALRFE